MASSNQGRRQMFVLAWEVLVNKENIHLETASSQNSRDRSPHQGKSRTEARDLCSPITRAMTGCRAIIGRTEIKGLVTISTQP